MGLPLAPWSHERTCELLGEEIQRFADVVQGATMTTVVPTCPEWTLAKLIRHTGTVHRWAAAMVADGATERVDPRTLDLGLPEHDGWLPGWLGGGGTDVVARLAAADPDTPVWAWGADQHVRFWPRRLLHETTMHRADAEITVHGDGEPPRIEAEIATDALDELLTNLPSSAAFSPAVAELKGEGSIGLSATDTRTHWVIQLSPDGFDAARVGEGEAEQADAYAGDFAADLLLVLSRRTPVAQAVNLEVQGQTELLDWWLEHCGLQ